MTSRLGLCCAVLAATTAISGQQAGPVGQAQPSGSGLMLGRVVDAGSDKPIPGVVVTIGPADALTNGVGVAGGLARLVRSALTDREGRFAFRHLPKATYVLTASMGGNGFSPSGFMVSGLGQPIAPYLPGAYGQRRPNGLPQPFDLAEGQRIGDLTIRLWKGGAVNGVVYDEAGDPLVGVVVSAVKQSPEGRLTTGPTTSTDDRGAYRLGTLSPGTYLIVVPQTQTIIPTATIDGLSPDPQVAMSIGALFAANGGPIATTTGVRLGPSTVATTAPNVTNTLVAAALVVHFISTLTFSSCTEG
jgi:hypothetical protein